jgi:hypothetical protein
MSAFDHKVLSLVIIVALTGGIARAQPDIDQNESGAQLFAANCAECHRSPRGLAKDRLFTWTLSHWTLSYVLQQHYAGSAASAQTLADYLQSVDASGTEPRPATAPIEAPEEPHAPMPSASPTVRKSQPTATSALVPLPPRRPAGARRGPERPKGAADSDERIGAQQFAASSGGEFAQSPTGKGSTAGERQPAADSPAKSPLNLPISLEQALYLIRATLLRLNDANISGNYTVMRDLAAPGFQAKNSAVDLAQIFSDLRRRKFELFAAAYMVPQLNPSPALDQNGMLHLVGIFPTEPLQISFHLTFQNVVQQWRLFGISVATPQAPPAQKPVQNSQPPGTANR